MVVKSIANPGMLKMLPPVLAVGLFIVVIPALLVAAIAGAGSGAIAGFLARLAKLPIIHFAFILAAMICVASFLPLAQGVLNVSDLMRGVSRDPRTIFDLQILQRFWPLAVLHAVPSLLVTLWVTSRGFSIPLFSKSRWLQPLDGAALGDKSVSKKEAEDR